MIIILELTMIITKTKVDYPSGTALMLANAVSKGKNKNLESIKGKIFFNIKKVVYKKIKLIFLLQEKEILLVNIPFFLIIK
jgi:hypothetical protein